MTGFAITKRFIAAQLLALCLSLFLAVFFRAGIATGLCLNGGVLILAVMDYFFTPGKKMFKAERVIPQSLEQNVDAEIELKIQSGANRLLVIRISDSPPSSFRQEQSALEYEITDQPVSHIYRVTPARRGSFSFGRCYVEVRGLWGLCLKRFSLDCPAQAGVYPNLTSMRHYRMLAERKQLAREDSSLHKIRGIGTDFSGLREYSPGDDRRKINWKASARAGKLITNVYDVEKNREVILAVDTGRWMQAAADGVTRLDRALELAAAIMQVALSSGDRVGLVLFDMNVTYYLAPGKGSAHSRAFLQALYHADFKSSPSSFPALSAVLRKKLTRRAFICLLTYLDNTDDAARAVVELDPLKRRHSVYIASLTDVGLDEIIQTEAAAPETVYLKVAAAYRKTAGLNAMDILRKHGIGANAAEPSELLIRSVRHYLTVKRLPQ